MASISFVLTLLFYIGLTLVNMYFSKPHRGEDGMALGTMLTVVGIGFLISSLILTFSIAWKGGFDWISPQVRARNLWVGAGWLCMVIAVFDSSFFESRWCYDFPTFLRWLAKSIQQLWIPLLMFAGYFFLFKYSTKSACSAQSL